MPDAASFAAPSAASRTKAQSARIEPIIQATSITRLSSVNVCFTERTRLTNSIALACNSHRTVPFTTHHHPRHEPSSLVSPVSDSSLLKRRCQPSGLHQRPHRSKLHQQGRCDRFPLRQGTMAIPLAYGAKAPSLSIGQEPSEATGSRRPP